MELVSARQNNKLLRSLLLKGSLILTLLLLFAILLHNTWSSQISLYHTILELACIFIALSSFFSMWFTYSKCSDVNHILGFGYLAVAIFDSLHTFYFLKLDLAANTHFDLSTWHFILGRLTEAIILLLYIQSVRIKTTRWVALSFVLVTVCGISCFITAYHDYLPTLLTEQGSATPIKTLFEYSIIVLYLFTLYKMKGKICHKSIATYKYIIAVLLLAIPSELCFSLYSTVTSVIWTIAHVLKSSSYYFLFKSIFVSAITHPYENLEIQHEKLNKALQDANYATETLSDVLDALPIAVIKYDLLGRIKYVNKKFEEMLSCDRNSIHDLTEVEFHKIFLYKDNGENLSEYKTLGSETGEKNVIKTYKTMNGGTIKLNVSTHKIRGGTLKLFYDVIKEQELENIHMQTQTILNAVSSCILVIDNNKKITLCNRASEEILELNRKAILGMDIDELNNLLNFKAKDLPNIALNGCIEKEFYKVPLTTVNGTKKELMLYLSSICNIDGEIIGAISVSTDITQFEEENHKMVQQEKLALLGQMGAGIVHETRNFLTTIKGRCQLIDQYAQDNTIKKHLSKINSDIDEVNAIISEFLFLSKPRESELAEVSMYDIIRSVQSMVEASSLIKGVDVDFYLSKEERYLMCDESQIKQVILNICKNAVDAMDDKSGAKIELKTGYVKETNHMYIKISDNGRGIPKEDLKKIGTPFFTTKKNGTGLGLSVCYRIIKNHNGSIEVESEIGKGTTFTIILPCIQDDECDDALE